MPQARVVRARPGHARGGCRSSRPRGVGPDRPCDTGEWRAAFLPEINFRNRHVEVERLTYALHTAAAFRTGLRPDVLADTYGWGGATLLPYATRAAVMTVRAVAGADPLAEACVSIAQRIPPLET